MARDLPVNARVALLAASACILFAAIATAGTAAQPFAPNDWSFSHVHLARAAIELEHMPLNLAVLSDGEFGGNHRLFAAETGLDMMTFYASTLWHFWNGLPLHPALIATLALGTGLSPETTMRLPLGGVALVLLAYASAALLLGHAAKRERVDARVAVIAPFLLAVACAPFALDMRVLMPSVTLVLVGLMLHATLRRVLLRDRLALALGFAPLAILPFWYYTVSYFVILLLVGFVAVDVALRIRFGRDRPVLVPAWAALAACAAITAVLFANGALTSHLKLATQMAGNWLAPDSGSDYVSHLNRQPWRSAVLYAETLALFAPLLIAGFVAARAFLAKRALGHSDVVFATWGFGAALFSLALESTVGVSFLNRSVIYLAPLGAVAAAMLLARVWHRSRLARVAFAGACAVLLVATTSLVATATPTYSADDADAYAWMGANVPRSSVVYAPLEVSSVLFRDEGFVNTLAFYPRASVLEDVWYSHDADTLVPYLASFDWFVVRREVMRSGFEEFGPLRQPIDAAAYAKFSSSRDLDLVFDDGEVQVYRVAMRADVTSSGDDAPR